ncbi:hypothetical protein ACF0H5_008980 [Mactra antiquata]
MKFEVSFFILCTFATGYGIDNTKFWKIPKPVKGFEDRLVLGRWFFQFRKAPCTWSGSSEFKDYETLISIYDKKIVMFTNFVRNDGLCTMFPSKGYKSTVPGTLVVKDPLGDKYSGLLVFPATDYKTYLITYVCVKMSTFGEKCDDALISIRTRMVHPDKTVIARINFVLMQLWGITVDELVRIQHGKSCYSKKYKYDKL